MEMIELVIINSRLVGVEVKHRLHVIARSILVEVEEIYRKVWILCSMEEVEGIYRKAWILCSMGEVEGIYKKG